MNTIWIALGGNMGDVAATLHSARNSVEQLDHTHIIASSLLYRTPPLGPPGQPDYRNAVIAVASGLEPLALLDALQHIETRHGRVRSEYWGARTLDLDIIAIDNDIIDTKRLSVPHPHMHNRQFVLRPLCDIAPNWQHPRLGKTASALLDALLLAGEPALEKGFKW
ncbi:MAG: 2-amino-4-hydroxy-6-hydroxymethyldihydropteridine diphosphokinase [Mariprofundus sp.]|nr:2-amino-4-hydroxy-6-hydroxymethyldihydropteridine diphosphokinase [Mariprofundus sp.]